MEKIYKQLTDSLAKTPEERTAEIMQSLDRYMLFDEPHTVQYNAPERSSSAMTVMYLPQRSVSLLAKTVM